MPETNWKSVKDSKYELAILPWEQKINICLLFVVEQIAAESASVFAWEQKGARIIVLPTMPFGVNTGQADIKLDINLNRWHTSIRYQRSAQLAGFTNFLY